jgi:hypothetical protein
LSLIIQNFGCILDALNFDTLFSLATAVLEAASPNSVRVWTTDASTATFLSITIDETGSTTFTAAAGAMVVSN